MSAPFQMPGILQHPHGWGMSCARQARPASDGIDKVVADLISSEWTQDKALSLVSKRAQLVRSGARVPR